MAVSRDAAKMKSRTCCGRPFQQLHRVVQKQYTTILHSCWIYCSNYSYFVRSRRNKKNVFGTPL